MDPRELPEALQCDCDDCRPASVSGAILFLAPVAVGIVVVTLAILGIVDFFHWMEWL